jgi:predicted DNA-binding protein
MPQKIEIELSDNVAKLLNELSVKVNQSSSNIVEEALIEYLSELRDADIALQRIKDKENEPGMTSEEVKKQLGL